MAERRSRIDPTLVTAIGGLAGGLGGLVIWMVTETFVFLPIFAAAGLVAGMAIAESVRRR